MHELRSLLPYLRRYRRAYAAGLVLVVVSNGFAVLGPRFIERGIDALRTHAPFHEVQVAIGLLPLVAALGGIARYGMRQLLNSGSRRVETDLRDQLYLHLQRMAAEFYDRYPTGDVMARTTNDLLAVRMVAGPALMYLVDTTLRALLIAPFMLAISPRLTVLALIPMLGLPLVMVSLGQLIHRRSQAIQAQFSDLTTQAHENLSGIRVVRAYRQERAEIAQFRVLSEIYLGKNLELARVQGLFFPLLTLLGGLSAVVVLHVGGGLIISGRVTVGEFVAFGVYLAMLVWPMIALGWAVNLVQRGAASMARINQLFHEPAAIADPAAPLQMPPAGNGRTVVFEHVWFRYPGETDRGWALQDVSFRVEAGRSLAIVGATGSGKSTLVDLLVRTYDPDRGVIRIDGVDIRRLPLSILRRAVGFVPQETFLFGETLRDNILLGAPDDGRLEHVAEVSQLSEALPALPAGFDTMLGERGINLSGTEAARRDRARAGAGPSSLRAGRCTERGGCAYGSADPGRPARRARGPHQHHRLPPTRGRPRRRLDPGPGRGPGSRGRYSCRPDLPGGRYWELLRRQQLEEELEEEGVGGR